MQSRGPVHRGCLTNRDTCAFTRGSLWFSQVKFLSLTILSRHLCGEKRRVVRVHGTRVLLWVSARVRDMHLVCMIHVHVCLDEEPPWMPRLHVRVYELVRMDETSNACMDLTFAWSRGRFERF